MEPFLLIYKTYGDSDSEGLEVKADYGGGMAPSHRSLRSKPKI